MKYFCMNCNLQFNSPDEYKELNSLIKSLMLKCPNCNSSYITLTEKGKLLVERKAKIKKLNM